MSLDIEIFRSGRIAIGDHSLVKHVERKSDKGFMFSFIFNNGFVISVHDFNVDRFIDVAPIITFSLFGFEEQFISPVAFILAIHVISIEDDCVAGRVAVYIDHEYVKLGEFKLSRDGSEYKGVSSSIVYDKTRYVKELVLGSGRKCNSLMK